MMMALIAILEATMISGCSGPNGDMEGGAGEAAEAANETGKIEPIIDKPYAFDEIPEALQYVGEGRAKGKVVITLESNFKT